MNERLALEGRVLEVPDDSEDLRVKVRKLERENSELRHDLDGAKRDLELAQESMQALRTALQPLYNSLRRLFGELEAAGVEEANSVAGPNAANPSTSGPIPSAVFDAWKQRLPPACGKIIDALLVQPMASSHLASFCKMHYDTVTKMLAILKKNGLIEKDGTLNKLRRM